MTSWGARIFEVRQQAEMSRQDFALRIGEPDYLIQRWELEGSEPLIHTALHVAQRLGLCVDDLTGPESALWDGSFTSSERVGKHDTRWRWNISTLCKAAGNCAAFAREISEHKVLINSWVYRRSIPTLRVANRCAQTVDVALHDLLTADLAARVAT